MFAHGEHLCCVGGTRSVQAWRLYSHVERGNEGRSRVHGRGAVRGLNRLRLEPRHILCQAIAGLALDELADARVAAEVKVCGSAVEDHLGLAGAEPAQG